MTVVSKRSPLIESKHSFREEDLRYAPVLDDDALLAAVEREGVEALSAPGGCQIGSHSSPAGPVGGSACLFAGSTLFLLRHVPNRAVSRPSNSSSAKGTKSGQIRSTTKRIAVIPNR